VVNDTCCIQEPGQPLRGLAIKGSCKYQGEVNGTWFQINHLTNHWTSFRQVKFQANK